MDYPNASYHGRVDIEARLARIEARQVYADVSLAYMRACRRYIELHLNEAFDDVAQAGYVGLPTRVDSVFEGLGTRLADIDVHLRRIRSCPTYAEEEVGLSTVEAGLEDVEVGLVGIGATLVHADTLLLEVGVGR